MIPFSFRAVPAIKVEWGAARKLGDHLAGALAGRRLLVVTDKGLLNAGVIEPALQSLRAAGFDLTVFSDVEADPSDTILLGSAQKARDAGCDAVLGLGGGSSLDVAKLAAVLAVSDQDLSEMWGIGNVRDARLPLVQMPTTAGTGSESTNISILTVGGVTKMGVVSDQLYADLVILDAELTTGLPKLHTAATGIDAMVHAIEAYTSRHKKNPISDAFARAGLDLLAANLVAACEDGGDRTAREAMLLGANLAGQAFANAPVAAVHALAYPLGGRFHIPHGLSNALMLGPVLSFNAGVAAPHYAELAAVVLPGITGTDIDRAAAFIASMTELMDRSGAPRRLRDVGVDEASLPQLAADAMLQQRLLVNNPVEVNEADALALYRQAY